MAKRVAAVRSAMATASDRAGRFARWVDARRLDREGLEQWRRGAVSR